jgi:hypothetical protein
MNFSFREPSPHIQPTSKKESNPMFKKFSDEQLQLLEERRASTWLHTHIKESVTEESIEHDRHLAERMLLLGLTAEDYEYFIEHYSELGSHNKNTLH